jgi:hypothetical protein
MDGLRVVARDGIAQHHTTSLLLPVDGLRLNPAA